MNKKIKLFLHTAIILLVGTLYCDVPALPSWVIAPAASMPGMPTLSPQETAKNCQNNARKAEAVLFVEQYRYVGVLQNYIHAIQNDIVSRSTYIQQLNNAVIARKQNIAELQTLITQDIAAMQPIIKQLNQSQTSLAQLQTQAQSSQLNTLIQQATKGFQQDQQLLTDKTAQLAQIKEVTQQDKDNLTFILKWLQFHRDYDSKLISYYQNEIQQIQQGLKTDPDDYAGYESYIPTYQNMLSSLQTAQPIATSSLAQQLLDAMPGGPYANVTYKTTPTPSDTDVQNFETTYASVEETAANLQAALNDLNTLNQYAQLQQETAALQTSLPGQLDVLSKGFSDEMQQQMEEYNNAIAEANFFAAQKEFFQNTIDLHKTAINALSGEISQLVQQIQQISSAINQSLVAAITTAQVEIQHLAEALQNPSAGLFDACPFFLQGLLKS